MRDEFGDKTGTETNFTTDWETKVLGGKWNALSDTFSFSVNHLDDVTYTKRGLMSKLLGLFDPLGLAAPFNVKRKIRMQRLVIADDRQFSELHVLCDASEEAFATVLYIRNTDLAGTYLSSNLVISKMRVEPRKTINSPKRAVDSNFKKILLDRQQLREKLDPSKGCLLQTIL